MKNMDLWKSVFVTDPKHVKPITGKQYAGNSPKPYWIVQRATETFGPCGIGWGVKVLDERVERFGDEAIHIAKVQVWYEIDGKHGEIEQMGQTKMAYMTSKGKALVDEDAPKKSVTDAMIKCLSLLGFAGDIFSGRWDDSRYVEWASEETKRREDAAHLMTPQQVEILTQLINDTGTDFEAFMAWISKGARRQCKSLSDTPADAFEPAKKALETKPKKTAEQEASA